MFTPFGAVYRYEDYDSALVLDREQARQTLRELRAWVEEQLRDRDRSEFNPLA